mmetsp:Transcript_56043/g.123104  ORF Transcript_56043/g.123104 Transcript_56043/m.123104 type:complete len:137 (-) Transcript_56043:521-931(-)
MFYWYDCLVPEVKSFAESVGEQVSPAAFMQAYHTRKELSVATSKLRISGARWIERHWNDRSNMADTTLHVWRCSFDFHNEPGPDQIHVGGIARKNYNLLFAGPMRKKSMQNRSKRSEAIVEDMLACFLWEPQQLVP